MVLGCSCLKRLFTHCSFLAPLSVSVSKPLANDGLLIANGGPSTYVPTFELDR